MFSVIKLLPTSVEILSMVLMVFFFNNFTKNIGEIFFSPIYGFCGGNQMVKL